MNFVNQLEDHLRDLGAEARKNHPGASGVFQLKRGVLLWPEKVSMLMMEQDVKKLFIVTIYCSHKSSFFPSLLL